jgi:glycosyltransferase involved in cell wall biosynthesis
MKIALIGNDYVQQFPIISYGGIETVVENLAIGLSKHFKDSIKFDVYVPKILERKNEKYDFSIIETDFIEGSKSGQSSNIFINEVKKIIDSSSEKPDIIWSQSEWSAKAFLNTKYPVICNMHASSGWEDGKYVYAKNIFYRFVSKYILEYTFLDANKDEFINDVKSQSFWCHSGLIDEEYEFENHKENYALWVAGLHWGPEAKGLDMFIEMAKRSEDIKFLAYGTGNKNLEEYLYKISKEIKNFEFMGKLHRGQSHKDVYKKAKFFCMLSKIPEAFGRTGLEAISKGTPVLGTEYGSIPEQVNFPNVGFCTNNQNVMLEKMSENFNYKECFEFSKKYHIKNEINFLINKSKEIICSVS